MHPQHLGTDPTDIWLWNPGWLWMKFWHCRRFALCECSCFIMCQISLWYRDFMALWFCHILSIVLFLTTRNEIVVIMCDVSGDAVLYTCAYKCTQLFVFIPLQDMCNGGIMCSQCVSCANVRLPAACCPCGQVCSCANVDLPTVGRVRSHTKG